MARLGFLALVATVTVLWSAPGATATLVGRVVSIADGDTLTFLVGRQRVRIRLAEIDAPRGKSRRRAGRERRPRAPGLRVVVPSPSPRHQSRLALEGAARSAHSGLWVDVHPIPPWGSGATAGNERTPLLRTARAAALSGLGGFTCGAKRYCRDTQSCAEARRFYLEPYGLRRLDGDGVPCETLCR